VTPSRLLVTGAGGFVGRHFLRAARAAWPDAEITAAVRTLDVADGGVPGANRIMAFDLLDTAGVQAAIQAVLPDVCVHLAAFSDVAASFTSSDLAWRVNVDGTRALAACLMNCAPTCWLIHAGSADAYGLSFMSGSALDESAAFRPANPYAASKAAADLALGELALRGLRVVRLRPVNHVGPGQSPRFAVASFARQIARVAAGAQPPVIRTGALDRWRDVLHVRDVCAAYVRAVQCAESLPPAAVFNVASGTPRHVGDVLADLVRMAGISVEIKQIAAAMRPVDVARSCCAAASAQVALGWAPLVAWDDTLLEILEYWRNEIKEELLF
jgi:GDP-4-dehydro-6-deoxy-D-mannose reductase